MGKWIHQAQEIERLRRENQRLVALLAQLQARLGEEAGGFDLYGVSTEERRLVASGHTVAAIKTYRERTGADLLTAKNAIDSVEMSDRHRPGTHLRY
ncbi:50S ribosomal protein L7/L12 [Arcanobacterium hippocoleae]|uniref:50S ribosomal protein L7/L12 n=1 Tax=Arcanobacterium hippocoleae TaxID=149017 RepID=UPI00334219B6